MWSIIMVCFFFFECLVSFPGCLWILLLWMNAVHGMLYFDWISCYVVILLLFMVTLTLVNSLCYMVHHSPVVIGYSYFDWMFVFYGHSPVVYGYILWLNAFVIWQFISCARLALRWLLVLCGHLFIVHGLLCCGCLCYTAIH